MTTATNPALVDIATVDTATNAGSLFARLRDRVGTFGSRAAKKHLDRELSVLTDSYLHDLGVSRADLMQNRLCEADRRMVQARVNYWI